MEPAVRVWRIQCSLVALEDRPEAQVTDGVSIDGFATWRASRLP